MSSHHDCGGLAECRFLTDTIYAYATGHDPGIQIKHPKEN